MIRVSHDYLDPTFISDPYPYFKKIREEMPVHWNERWRGWIVTRYDDVYGALHNDNLLADTITPYFQALKPEDQEKYALTYDVLNSWTVFLDPPKHTRLRRMMQRAFTPRAIAKMREVVESIVLEQLNTWKSKKQIDVIDDFAYPLPANVIARMIGAPAKDVHLFHVWADALTNLLHGGVGTADRWARAQITVEEFKDYLSGLYVERKTSPRPDMMSWLMEAEAADPAVRKEDVIYSCMLLMVAGHETTQNLIANTLVALLAAPTSSISCAGRSATSAPPSRRACATTARPRARCGQQPRTWRSGAFPSARTNACFCGWPLRTGTRRSSPTPRCSTSRGARTRTSPSATASTSAWAHPSRGWSWRSHSRTSCAASRSWRWPGPWSTGPGFSRALWKVPS